MGWLPIYNAMPKTARRPPAKMGAPYCARGTAAPELAAGVVEPVGDDEAPEEREAVAVAEPEGARELTAPASLTVRLPQLALRACSHWNCWARFWLVA
jgi:hypothetical protein|tara:strand:- start:10106 stop:10399 length:294 start_codon:yes stop_codon:yes gene_type:complete